MADAKWDLIIRPKDKLLSVDFAELWSYRDLWSLFVKRNIIVQYKQTVLGPVWYVVQPTLTVLMYMLVFGGIAGIATDGIPQPLFYLAGTCMWQYFSDCLNRTSDTFTGNAGIFGKVYFPRLIMPLASMTSNLLRFGIQFCLFLVVYAGYALSGSCGVAHFTPYALLFPVLVVMLAGLALGFGIIVSAFTTKYRDLQVLFTFIVSLWMYATPIVYPLSLTEGRILFGLPLRAVMSLNPVTPVLETFKYGFLGAGEFIGWGWLGYSLGVMAVMLVLGIVLFNKVQKNFMDTV